VLSVHLQIWWMVVLRLTVLLLCALTTTSAVAFAGAKKPAFILLGGIATDEQQITRQSAEDVRLPEELARKTVDFQRPLQPGSILVKTEERKLYFVLPDHKALQYSVGVGREGFTWSGTNRISAKAEWPTWTPPPVMVAREAERGHYLPESMPGGPDNPLGARAMYIGHTDFRIHGTTQPWSIGQAVSSGCIRMVNADVIDLYSRVKIGTLVVVE
jgi:lipoprotein-anchoring transpeptidase ErfK/SrfK